MQKKIKLLHITSSLKMGGAESLLCDLIKNMDTTMFEHHVIYFHDGPHSVHLKELGIPLHQIKGLVSLYDPVFCARLYAHIKKINPDIMHTLLWAANLFGRMCAHVLNIPVVCAMHNNVDQDGFIRALFDRATLKMADKFIAVSEGVAESMRKRDAWLPAHKIQIIPNGIDFKNLQIKNEQAKKSRQELGLSSDHFVIGSVGRFMPVKRYDLMLESFALLYAQYSHARLVLVGIGDMEMQLRKLAAHLRIDHAVTFIIGQPAYQYYSLFDCFSLSSDKEGISIALLEAMSFGLPCVVTSSESSHAVLQHEINGLIVPAGNVQQLSQAWAGLMGNKLLKELLGDCARKTVVQEFDYKKMVSSYQTCFKDICAVGEHYSI